MERIKWFNRNFNFSSNQNIFPAVIERLSGTPARLEEKFKNIPEEHLTKKVDNTWTIKENAGHLTDLEPLWLGWLNEILDGKKELSPADPDNTKTKTANHNEVPADELLEGFRKSRKNTVAVLEGLNEKQIFLSAVHPRLKIQMKTMDLFKFVAEHDDHHLARITELLKTINQP